MLIMFLKDHFRGSGATGILLIILLFWQEAMGQNLVINGNFESGNQVGFSSGYTFIPNPTGTTLAGQYGIGNSPQPFNPASFFEMGDHTSGRGNMMIVDGTNYGGNTEPFFWRINNNGEICGLTIGETYTFSYWVKSIYRNTIFGATSADIGIKWNNVQGQSPLGIIIPATGSMIVLPPSGDWQQVTYHFVPTNSCVRIEMFDRNGNLAGNDFAIDDIELLPPLKPLQLSYALIPPSCPEANDGFIAAYGRGGKEPYTYSFNGRPFSSTLLLSGLGAVSRQYISLRDGNAPSTEVSVSDISLPAPANPLDAGPNGTVCAGQVYQLNATGGSSYTWTATPEDTSLTTPNIANPVVKPLVNTLYQVTSQVNMVRNLIFNWDFSEGSSGGNVGFGSDYFHRHANPDGFQGIYAIVSNAQTFYPDLPACTGTGGTGDQMFVADGSTAGNARVWWQEVPVQPNTNYTFTYYLQSVHSASPALIETRVNNQPITGNSVTSTQPAPNATCTWRQVNYSWNSGASTSALICLFNRNLTAVGNDFALDNISFSTNIVCTVSRQVMVTVTREETPTASVTLQPGCYNQGSISISAPLGTQYEYSLDSVNYQDSPTFSNVLPGSYNIRTRNKVSSCISNSLRLTVTPPPSLPATPTGVVSAQPTCAFPYGAIFVSAPIDPYFTYSIDGISFQADNHFSMLDPGLYHVRVRDYRTACISGLLPLVVNPVPVTLEAPQGTVTIQPTCTEPTGTIVITSPSGTGLEYSVNGNTWQTGRTFSGLSPNTYEVRVRNTAGNCSSNQTTLVVNAISDTPASPAASVTFQPDCAVPTGTILITYPTGNDWEYSLNGTSWQTGTTFSRLSPGTYNLRVRKISVGCNSNTLQLVVNPPPATPATPVATVTAQPDCFTSSGTITVTSPIMPLMDYSVDGINFQVGMTFAGLLPGNYVVRARNNITGCISTLTTPLVINSGPQSPPAPVVNTPVTHCQFATGIQPLTADGTNLKWYDVATGGTGSSIAPVPGVAIAGSTLWYVSQSYAAGCESPRSAITVNISESPVITIPLKAIEIQYGQSVSLPATITGQGVSISWSPATGLNNPFIDSPLARPENTTTYSVLASNSQACSASDTIRVVVLKDIIVPNVFSPNGDGINDQWLIKHLENYQDATLEIFDRYGKPVFRGKTKAMPWDGTVGGKQVPAGTYYYLIKLDSKKVLNGSVTVLR